MPSHQRVPKTWTTKSGVQIIPDLDKTSLMQDLVDRTWRAKKTRDRTGQVPTRARVLSVLRVENHDIYQKFAKHKAELRKKRKGDCPNFDVETDAWLSTQPQSLREGMDGDINEVYLFHGTFFCTADCNHLHLPAFCHFSLLLNANILIVTCWTIRLFVVFIIHLKRKQ